MKHVDTKDIQISEIDDTVRLRPLNLEWVADLSEQISQAGQKTAIEVVTIKSGKFKFKLSAGGHRVAAFRILGLTTIRADIYQIGGKNAEFERELAEIDENLQRLELNALDRAVFIGRRKEIYEKLNPETKHGVAGANARHGSANDKMSFAKSTAEKMKRNEKLVQRACRIYDGISAAARKRIANTPLALKEGELYQLTYHSPENQTKILDMCLRADDPVPSIKLAGDIIDGHVAKKPSAADADFEKLYDTWKRRDSKPGRRRFLEALQEMGVIDSFNEGQL